MLAKMSCQENFPYAISKRPYNAFLFRKIYARIVPSLLHTRHLFFGNTLKSLFASGSTLHLKISRSVASKTQRGIDEEASTENTGQPGGHL